MAWRRNPIPLMLAMPPSCGVNNAIVIDADQNTTVVEPGEAGFAPF